MKECNCGACEECVYGTELFYAMNGVEKTEHMGDRISIQFKNGNETSIVFFSHWDGKEMINAVNRYIAVLKKEVLANRIEENNIRFPLDRLEPNIVMLDFIRWFAKDLGRINSNYYLGKDQNDGDNSDNGNWVYDLNEDSWI